MTALKNKIIETMSAVLGISEDEINESSSIDTIEQWDSLKHMNLILALEAAFDISFTDEESIEITSYELIKLTIEAHGVALA